MWKCDVCGYKNLDSDRVVQHLMREHNYPLEDAGLSTSRDVRIPTIRMEVKHNGTVTDIFTSSYRKNVDNIISALVDTLVSSDKKIEITIKKGGIR